MNKLKRQFNNGPRLTVSEKHPMDVCIYNEDAECKLIRVLCNSIRSREFNSAVYITG